MIVRFSVEAMLEVLEAQARLEEDSPGLGERFQRALDEAVRMIADAPRRWPRDLSVSSRREIRFVTLRPFSFKLVYEVKARTLDVLAVSHLHREPGYWIRRMP